MKTTDRLNDGTNSYEYTKKKTYYVFFKTLNASWRDVVA